MENHNAGVFERCVAVEVDDSEVYIVAIQQMRDDVHTESNTLQALFVQVDAREAHLLIRGSGLHNLKNARPVGCHTLSGSPT